ncbi:MAG: PGF-pre-PGF domain-containing protein, partial [Nanoarchaeota archaeon]
LSGTWNVSGINFSSFIEGTHNATVFANDTVNNLNNTVTVFFTVDRTVPVVTVECTPFTSSVGQNVQCACSASDGLSGVRSTSFPGGVTTKIYNVGAAGTFTTDICTAVDHSGNSGTGTSFFTVGGTTGGSSSGGGGGGSSGGVTGQFEKKTWATLNSGETATVDVPNGVIGVKQVSITMQELVRGVWLEVRNDGVPGSIEMKFNKKVYKTMQISVSPTLKYDNIKNAEVKFRVEKTWLEENKLPKEHIALFRYIEVLLPEKVTGWAELPTQVGKDDYKYVDYTADTPGFSYFLIGEKSREGELIEEVKQGSIIQKLLPEKPSDEPSEIEAALVGGAAGLPFGSRLKNVLVQDMDLVIFGVVILAAIILIGVVFGKKQQRKREGSKAKLSKK